jgi:OpgC protein
VTRSGLLGALAGALSAAAARLRRWRYESLPRSAGSRDLRIDLLRGFCVFVMIVDHVGGESSWLYVLTGGNRFMVSAAEGFVLLSGIAGFALAILGPGGWSIDRLLGLTYPDWLLGGWLLVMAIGALAAIGLRTFLAPPPKPS